MATINPIVSGLTSYVDQDRNKEILIAKTALSGKSIKLFNLQTGVKGKTSLYTLDANPVFGDGSSCGFESDGTVTISERFINAKALKVNMEFCERNLLGVAQQYAVKLAAGLLGEDPMPFEEYFTSQIIKRVNEKLEKMVYQGDGDEDNEFDGIVTILSGETSTIKPSLSGTTVIDQLYEVYNAMPEEVITSDDAAILVTPAVFRKYVQELTMANLFHYKENDTTGEVYMPGTNVLVKSVNGLIGSTSYNVVAGRLSNVYVGTDFANSEEDFKISYDERTETFLLKILFSMGTQVAFPDQEVIAKVTL